MTYSIQWMGEIPVFDPGTSGLQVQRPYHWATLPPHKGEALGVLPLLENPAPPVKP